MSNGFSEIMSQANGYRHRAERDAVQEFLPIMMQFYNMQRADRQHRDSLVGNKVWYDENGSPFVSMMGEDGKPSDVAFDSKDRVKFSNANLGSYMDRDSVERYRVNERNDRNKLIESKATRHIVYQRGEDGKDLIGADGRPVIDESLSGYMLSAYNSGTNTYSDVFYNSLDDIDMDNLRTYADSRAVQSSRMTLDKLIEDRMLSDGGKEWAWYEGANGGNPVRRELPPRKDANGNDNVEYKQALEGAIDSRQARSVLESNRSFWHQLDRERRAREDAIDGDAVEAEKYKEGDKYVQRVGVGGYSGLFMYTHVGKNQTEVIPTRVYRGPDGYITADRKPADFTGRVLASTMATQGTTGSGSLNQNAVDGEIVNYPRLERPAITNSDFAFPSSYRGLNYFNPKITMPDGRSVSATDFIARNRDTVAMEIYGEGFESLCPEAKHKVLEEMFGTRNLSELVAGKSLNFDSLK